MGIPADQIMALTQRCAQAEVDRDKARARVAELEGQISAFDCRLVGRVGELSGSHCPADRPCDRCIAERRIEELSHAYAVQGLAIEELTAERDALRARVAELEALLRRAKAVIPDEFEDEIEVRAAITRYLNAHQG